MLEVRSFGSVGADGSFDLHYLLVIPPDAPPTVMLYDLELLPPSEAFACLTTPAPAIALQAMLGSLPTTAGIRMRALSLGRKAGVGCIGDELGLWISAAVPFG